MKKIVFAHFRRIWAAQNTYGKYAKMRKNRKNAKIRKWIKIDPKMNRALKSRPRCQFSIPNTGFSISAIFSEIFTFFNIFSIFAIFRVLESIELQIEIARNLLEISILRPKQFYSRSEWPK